MQDEVHPIPTIYLHLVAVMDLMSLRRPDEARTHLMAAWELARPDDLIEGFGEHHGLLGGMLEAVIKPAWPEDFRRIIDITYRFSAGWRRIHNPATGDAVADNLTTTEFASSMLAARGWTNVQIAEHLGISPNTGEDPTYPPPCRSCMRKAAATSSASCSHSCSHGAQAMKNAWRERHGRHTHYPFYVL